MTVRAFLTLVLAPLMLSCDEPAGEPVTRTALGAAEPVEGEEESRFARDRAPSACRDVTFDGARFTHCLAEPDKHRIATALRGNDGNIYRSLANLAGGRPATGATVAFATNGGMFDGEGKPIGYYVENGSRLKELNRNDGPGNFHLKPNGVFFGTEGKWQVRTSDDFYSNVGDRPNFGTQSGPMLVIQGKLHPEIADNGPSKARRNGVGVDEQGNAHFVLSEEAVSFGQLARLYRDVLKVPNALFLDGNVSALWSPAQDRLDSGLPIGPIIVIENQE